MGGGPSRTWTMEGTAVPIFPCELPADCFANHGDAHSFPLCNNISTTGRSEVRVPPKLRLHCAALPLQTLCSVQQHTLGGEGMNFLTTTTLDLVVTYSHPSDSITARMASTLASFSAWSCRKKKTTQDEGRHT